VDCSNIVVGVDEAGYGPVLGPLVVSAAVFETRSLNAIPDFWDLLREVPVRPPPARHDESLVIGDSKQIYAGTDGLARLETGVVAFALAASLPEPATLDGFLGRFAAELSQPPSHIPWYSGPDVPVPCDSPHSPRADALKRELERSGLKFHGFLVRPVFEPEFNSSVRKYGNKSHVLFDLSAGLVEEILQSFPSTHTLHFVLDKQGSRNNYGALLVNRFPDYGFLIERESQQSSSYRLVSRTRVCHIQFEVKGDVRHLPVGLASMCSKYVRELYLRKFNAFWAAHLPGIRPTAGYYTDAQRFLAETEGLRKQMKIGDECLIRCR
jgi:ribonuclease HII